MMRVRCPACLTTFRIKEAHLHTRSGKVRCGRCYTPFNALENLLYDSPPSSQPPPRHAAPGEMPRREAPPQKTNPVQQRAPAKNNVDTNKLFDFDEKLHDTSSAEDTNPNLPLDHLAFGPSVIRSSPRNKIADNAPSTILPSVRSHAPLSDFPSLTEHAATHFALRDNAKKTSQRNAPLSQPASETAAPPPSSAESSQPSRTAAYTGTDRRGEVRLDLPPAVRNAITLSELPYRRASSASAERQTGATLHSSELPTEQPSVFKHRHATTTPPAPAAVPRRETHHIEDEEDSFLDAIYSPNRTPERDKNTEPALSLLDDEDEYEDEEFSADENPYYTRHTRSGGVRRSIWGVIIGTLLGVLIVQGAYLYREDITRIWPQTRPAYLKLCAFVGCTLPLPRTAGAINIETSDLESDPQQPNRYVLNALLRNTAPYTLQYPYLELSLTDVRNKTLVRRALPPQEWLPSARLDEGIAAGKEIALRLPFEAQGIDNAVGYQIYAFYP